MRTQRSKDELRKASDHLNYEIWMLDCMATALALGLAGDGRMKNSFLESFVIHARALLQFLYAEAPRADDVIAEDFFEDPLGWHTSRPAMTPLLSTVRRRVGKEAAHLTYARQAVNPDDKPWEFLSIARDLQQVVESFLRIAPQDLLGPRWGAAPNQPKA